MLPFTFHQFSAVIATLVAIGVTGAILWVSMLFWDVVPGLMFGKGLPALLLCGLTVWYIWGDVLPQSEGRPQHGPSQLFRDGPAIEHGDPDTTISKSERSAGEQELRRDLNRMQNQLDRLQIPTRTETNPCPTAPPSGSLQLAP